MKQNISANSVGFVFIGRNEGDRLKACINSLQAYDAPQVYVDSGSTDDSVNYAQSQGITVIHLDTSIPFTAARARNAGWRALLETNPDIRYIQFLDGDCILDDAWIAEAKLYLDNNHDSAIACGQRKELKPNDSFYNELCDFEWNTPPGAASACGGDFMVRTTVLTEVNGFRDDFIAGEEPEMCFRIRGLGHLIYRLDKTMTWHDADIHTFYQWWKRSKRCGYAYALGAFTHGLKTQERYKLRQTARSFFWGLGLPVTIIFCAVLLSPWFFLAFSIYGISYLKNLRSSPKSSSNRILYAFYTSIGKFSEASGVLAFAWNSIRKRKGSLIEYK